MVNAMEPLVDGPQEAAEPREAAPNDAEPRKDELKENAKQLFTRGELGQYWNDLYDTVDNCRDFHFVQRLEIVSTLIAARFARNSKLLDLGCGAGVLTERLVASGFDVDAVDIAPDMLEFSRQRLSKYDRSKYRLAQAECSKLPFPDAAFDVVACIGVFGYMEDVDAAIREIKRVLRPGGTLILSIRNLDHVTVFDGFFWLKAPFVALPKAVLRRLAARRTPNGKGGAGAARHAIAIYDQPRKVERIFGSFGFRLGDFRGAGYGPPTFRGNPLISEARAKKLSRALDRAVHSAHLEERAKWYADISVYVFENES
jgi:ubiquinone/menaquinone biosynthesis C-methylase UbiE